MPTSDRVTAPPVVDERVNHFNQSIFIMTKMNNDCNIINNFRNPKREEYVPTQNHTKATTSHKNLFQMNQTYKFDIAFC